MSEKTKTYLAFVIAAIIIIVQITIIGNIWHRYNLAKNEGDGYKQDRKVLELKNDSLVKEYTVLKSREQNAEKEKINAEAQYDSLKKVLKQKEIVYVYKNLPVLHASISVLDSLWTSDRFNH